MHVHVAPRFHARACSATQQTLAMGGAQAKQAEEEAAKLKAEQDAKVDEDDDSEQLTLADRIIGLFEKPPLDKLKPTLEPALDYLEEHPSYAYGLLAIPALILLSIVRGLFGGKVRACSQYLSVIIAVTGMNVTEHFGASIAFIRTKTHRHSHGRLLVHCAGRMLVRFAEVLVPACTCCHAC